MSLFVPGCAAGSPAYGVPLVARELLFHSEMERWIHRARVAAAFVAMGLLGCEAECDQATVDRAVQFLESHQSCEVDADCVIVGDFCGEIPSENALCGQLTMNEQGKQSAEWRGIEEELGDCAPSECTRCLAARVPGCSNGSCGGN